jgi:amidase
MIRITRDDENLHALYRADVEPVATVKVGDQIAVETAHHLALYKRVLTEDDLIEVLPLDQVNPLTGPIAVEGAEPGDTVVLTIEDIEVGAHGDCPLIPGIGLMQEHLSAPYMRILKVRDGQIEFGAGLSIPVAPIIGDLGASPTEPVHTVYPGYHGGNLDDPNITTGATVYLPVSVPRGMMYLGDVHAAQGDTEWCGPLEVDAVVTLTVVDLIKRHRLGCVWTETATHWITYGTEKTLYDSLESAAIRLTRFVANGFGLSLEDAALLMSNVGNLRLCQAVKAPFNPVVRAEFPKAIDAAGRLSLHATTIEGGS